MDSADIPSARMKELFVNVKKVASGDSIRRKDMPRDIPIGNGSFLIAFDKDYVLRDLYFPYVGLENHSIGHPFRFAVWVDGQFSEMGPEWTKDLRYIDDTLATQVKASNPRLGIELT